MRREFPEMPLMGVGAVIVDKDQVLFVRRGTEPMKGRWSIPGGLVELGETLTAAVQREVKEETGLDVEVVELIELVDRIYREDTRVRYHYVIADYLCRVTGGEVRAGSDAAGTRWAGREGWTGANTLEIEAWSARIVDAGWRRAQAVETMEQPEDSGERG